MVGGGGYGATTSKTEKPNNQKSGEKKIWLGASLTRNVAASTDHELTLCCLKCTFGRSYADQNVHLADLMLVKMYSWQISC